MWEQNKGKCGICGDAYHMPSPRPHEAGGEYARGILTKFYAAGQVCMTFLYYFLNAKFSFSTSIKWITVYLFCACGVLFPFENRSENKKILIIKIFRKC